MSIVKDIQTGALPKKEILSFIGWILSKLGWFFVALAGIGLTIALIVTNTI